MQNLQKICISQFFYVFPEREQGVTVLLYVATMCSMTPSVVTGRTFHRKPQEKINLSTKIPIPAEILVNVLFHSEIFFLMTCKSTALKTTPTTVRADLHS